MYRFSRSMYQQLAPSLVVNGDRRAAMRARAELLRACELTVRRIALDRHFAAPAGSLFESVRWQFAISDHERVRRVIERHVALAVVHARKLTADRLADFQPRCAAHSREGNPCRRKPVTGDVHCPSHRWLSRPAATAERR